MIMLVFMSFRIGRDLGVVLAKGVFLSMVSVCTFLPALILATTDTIFKYNKKYFDPNMDGLARFTSRFFRPMAVLFLLLFAGSYILQARTPFSYTLFQDDPVADVFPLENQIVLLYSNEDEEAVAKIADDLMEEDHTRSVMSYSTTLARGYTVRELADVMTDMGSETLRRRAAQHLRRGTVHLFKSHGAHRSPVFRIPYTGDDRSDGRHVPV